MAGEERGPEEHSSSQLVAVLYYAAVITVPSVKSNEGHPSEPCQLMLAT